MRTLRLLGISYWLHLKMIAVSAFDGIFQVIWPLYFATVAFLLYGQSGNPGVLVYAGLGAAVMGTWSGGATTARGRVQRGRRRGTHEHQGSTPTPGVP